MTSHAHDPDLSDTLIDGAAHLREADRYRARLRTVKDRHEAYHPDCQRRYAADAFREACRRLGVVEKWLSGEYDRTYAGPLGDLYSDLDGFRLHYADDALRGALHQLVRAEHYAGLRTRESALAADPLRL